MNIKRDKYLNDLINRMHNGMIKVITGVRRCGKSYLLFNISIPRFDVLINFYWIFLPLASKIFNKATKNNFSYSFNC